jgi:hypothetical protein
MSKTKQAFMEGKWPGQPGPGEFPKDEVSGLPGTITQISLYKQSVKESILEGHLNPLDFYRRAKLIIDAIESLKKDQDIFDCAEQERAKYGKEKPNVNGSVVDISSRTTYDYESCEDPVYQELKEKLKAREAFLKNIPAGGVADPETGQIIQPPVQKISQFVTVKI